MRHQATKSVWIKPIAIFAILFGIITLFKAYGILFGPQSARDAVGNYVPFIVQFNFVAGFFYIAAGIGIYLLKGWAKAVSILIAVATILATAAFAFHVIMGGAYEMQTVGALAIRSGFWVAVVAVLRRKGPKT